MNESTIVIAGRPNVGKSTLFNRLVGSRRAVTHEQAGVTRDPIEEKTVMEGYRCTVVDTGGFTLSGDTLQRQIVEKCLAYLKRAIVIILVVEAQGLTAEDYEFIDVLRPYAFKVVVAVNKADNPETEPAAAELYATGFTTIIAVSAIHNRHIEKLKTALVKYLSPEDTAKGGDEDKLEDEKSEEIRIAILGKPNTGKSTLLNAVLSEDKALVSDIPGTTRDVISGRFTHKGMVFRIMDTAGIRKKKKVTEDLEYYSVTRAFDSIIEADIVLLLVDAEIGLTEQDKKIAAQAEKRGRGIILVVNKWDRMGGVQNAENAFADRIRFLFPILGFAPIIFISALYASNVPQLLDQTIRVWKQLNRTVKTATLNSHLQKWKTKNPLPRKNNFQWKIKYMTQKRTNPVTFVMFVNRKKGFPRFYTLYIINSIRKDFGLSKIPVRLEIAE